MNFIVIVLPFIFLGLALCCLYLPRTWQPVLSFLSKFVLPLIALMAFCMELVGIYGTRQNLAILSPDVVQTLQGSDLSVRYFYSSLGLIVLYCLLFGLSFFGFCFLAFRPRRLRGSMH